MLGRCQMLGIESIWIDVPATTLLLGSRDLAYLIVIYYIRTSRIMMCYPNKSYYDVSLKRERERERERESVCVYMS